MKLPKLPRLLPVLLLVLAVALVPALAMARAGGGRSFGSRGTHTYVAPPSTATSPYGAAPVERSLTPRPPAAPGYPAPGYPAPGYGAGYGYRGGSPFLSGLMGGLIGAGIGGLLFGGGLFGGVHGFGGLFGLLLQILLIVWLVRWLLRSFGRGPALAGLGMMPRTGSAPPAARAGAPAVAIGRDDYAQFEAVLREVQAAWSAQDLNRLRAIATPEMVSVLAEQMAEQTSRGVRNIVSDVRLQQGDLAEAWSEDGREYATVAMRFSLTDVTVDGTGGVVDGSPDERVTATEIWTFLRAPGGRWVLSAIQQTR